MKLLFVAILIIVNTSFIYSQSDFRRGFIVTLEKDTLDGWVNFSENNSAYRICKFRKTLTGTTVSYTPGELSAYGFRKDKVFETKKIKEDSVLTDHFFEWIISGEINLYRLRGFYWVSRDSGSIKKLFNTTELIDRNGRLFKKSSNQHIATLNTLMFDCTEAREATKVTRLTERSLSRIIEIYSKCRGKEVVFFKKNKPWLSFRTELLTGYVNSELSFREGFRPYEHLRGRLERSKHIAYGIGVDISSPRLSERLSFYANGIYSSAVYYNYNISSSLLVTTRNYVSINLNEFKIPFGVKYTFPSRSFTPFLMAGLSSTLHLTKTSNFLQEIELRNQVQTYSSDAFAIKAYQLGAWGGVGITKSIHPKIQTFVQLRYEITDGLVNTIAEGSDLFSDIRNFQILCGIKLR